MKRRSLTVLIAALTGALGFLAGKWWNPDAPPAFDHAPSAARQPVSVKSTPVKTAVERDAPVSPGAPVEKFAALHSRAAALPAEQFGQRYAELLTSNDSADVLLERAAMLASLDADRAVASYLAYKKRMGASLQQNTQEIRHLLTVAGEREGGKVIAAMQQAAPGFQEISSLVHGWAMKDPSAAVDWYNNVADNDPQRKTSLDGLMWGLSQRDGATARTVFHSLSPADQLTSGKSLGRALFTSNGGAEIDKLLEGLPPEAARECLQGACERSYRRAPAETAPWLAAHLGAAEAVDEAFLYTYTRWAASDPAAAEQWRIATVQSNPRISPLLEPAPPEPTLR